MYNKEAQRRYREKNRQKLIEASKQWRDDNHERFIETHRALRQTSEYKNREKQRVTQDRRNNPLKFVLQQARRRARDNNWEFNIDLDYLQAIWTGMCPILNIPLTIGREAGTVSQSSRGSLDRIDSSKGYIKGNVHFISNRANLIKNNATFTEFELIYNWWKANI